MSRRKSIKDKISSRETDNFVGRLDQIKLFENNLKLSFEDFNVKNIFNIYGQGGVGKTTLIEKYKKIALNSNFKIAHLDFEDKRLTSIPFCLNELVNQLKIISSNSFKSFTKKYNTYLKKSNQLISQLNEGNLFESVTNDALKIGLQAIPGGSIVKDFLPMDSISEGTSNIVRFAWKMFGNKDDVQLVLNPLDILTKIWIDDLYKFTEQNQVCLLLDNYETSIPEFDIWLNKLIDEKFGGVPHNLLFVVSGRFKLDSKRWYDLRPLMVPIKLTPFTIEESTIFLNKHGISEKVLIDKLLKVSQRLPVYLSFFVLENEIGSNEHLEFPIEKVVDYILRSLKNNQEKNLAITCSVPRFINLDIIKRITNEKEPTIVFEWLRERTFIKKRGGEWAYHPVIREQFIEYLKQISKENWEITNLRIAEYYENCALNLGHDNIRKAKEDFEWVNFRLEYHYHKLCAETRKHYQGFFIDFLEFFINLVDRKRLLSWVNIFKVANKATINSDWSKVLEEGINNYLSKTEDYGRSLWLKLLETNWFKSSTRSKGVLHHLLGYCEELDNKYDEAIIKYKEAIDIDPDGRNTTKIYLVNILLKLNKLEESEKYIKDVIKLDPQGISANYHFGVLHEKRGEFEKAIEYFKLILNYSQDNNSKCHYYEKIAENYKNSNSFQEALKFYKKADKICSKNNISLYEKIFDCQILNGQTEEALKFIKGKIKENPDNIYLLIVLEIYYYSKEDYIKALSYSEKALSINPNNIYFLSKSGVIHTMLGNIEKSKECFKKAHDIKEDSYFANYWEAVSFTFLGNFEKAKQLLIKAILKSMPNDSKAVLRLGVIHINLEEYEEALVQFENALTIQINDATPYYYKAVIFEKIEKWDEAIIAYTTFLEKHPKNYEANLGLGRVMAIKEDFDKALEYFENVIRLKPDDDYTLIKIGWVLIFKNKIHDSFERLNSINSDHVDKNRLLGHIKLIQSENESAKKYYTNFKNLLKKTSSFSTVMWGDFDYLGLEERGVSRKQFGILLDKLKRNDR